MSHSCTNTQSVSSESSAAAAVSFGGGGSSIGHRSHHHRSQSKGVISPSSALVAASDSLVLENEQILKLFPKCRPRSQNETMNQFYASIKDQHQPPMSAASGVGGVSSNATASKTTSYNSGTSGGSNNNSAMKKLITDPSMMMMGSSGDRGTAANSMPFSSNLSSADYKMYAAVANKKERASTTNPFLINNNTSESQQREEQQHGSSSRGKLTHSQSDCGVCYVGGGGGGVGLIGANHSSSPFPSSASVSSQLSSSNCNTEMMSKNFQRHMKNSNSNPLHYQSNPFIGAAHKLDEYEEEQLNIIVQDQQQAAPEYYFDRRTVRPAAVTPPLVVHQSSHHKGYTAVPTNHSALHGMRSTPVGNLLHSPELKEHRETTVYNNYARDHHYLNVGRSPVNSNTGDQLNEEAENDEEMTNMDQGLYLEKKSPSPSFPAAEPQRSVRSNHHRGSPAPPLNTESTRSSTQFASKKRNKSVAVVSDGEVVIFDDIEESWYNLKVKPESIGEGHVYRQNFIADPEPVSPDRNSVDAICGGDEVTSTVAEVATVPARGSSVAGMVIEYSESPRRFGRSGQATTTSGGNSQYSPRPGFPHRIVTPSSPSVGAVNSCNSAFTSPPPVVVPYGSGGGYTGIEEEEEEEEVQAAKTLDPCDPESTISKSCKMNSIREDYEEQRHARVQEEEEEEQQQHRNHINEAEDLDLQTGINVLDNVYQDTGLSVRNDDDNEKEEEKRVVELEREDEKNFTVPTSTFDYLYEFSETRKVLEEFFKCPTFELDDDKFADKLSGESECDSVDIRYELRESSRKSPTMLTRRSIENLDSGSPTMGHQHEEDDQEDDDLHHYETTNPDGETSAGMKHTRDTEEVANEADVEDEATNDEPATTAVPLNHRRRTFDLSISSLGRQSPELMMMNHHHHHHHHYHNNNNSSSTNNVNYQMGAASMGNVATENGEDKNGQQANQYFRYSPETTDYDSNCGDLDSLSGGDFNAPQSVINYQAYMRQCYASMPVLEDGLSSGHASDAENNNTVERAAAAAAALAARNGLRGLGVGVAVNNGHSLEEGVVALTQNAESNTGGNMNPKSSAPQTTSSFPPHSVAALSSVRSSAVGAVGGVAALDGGNVTPNHRHFMQRQQQLATDNYYLNASNKLQPHTCLGNVLDAGLAGGVGPYEMSGNPNLGNRYNGDGSVQLNESLTNVPELHHNHQHQHQTFVGGGLDRNNKSNTFTGNGGNGATTPLIRDENLNTIDCNPPPGAALNKRVGMAATTPAGLNINSKIFKNTDPDLESLYSINKFQSNDVIQMTPPPPPAPVPYRKPNPLNPGLSSCDSVLSTAPVMTTTAPINVPTSTGPTAPTTEIQAALKDIRSTIHRTKSLQQDLLNTKLDHNDYHNNDDALNLKSSAVWIPSFSQCREDSAESTESDVLQELKNASEEEEPDTDLETDRLLGHQRSDDTGFYDSEKNWLNTNKRNSLLSKLSPKIPQGALSLNGLTSAGNKLPPPPIVNNNLIRHSLSALIPSPVPEHPVTPKTQSSNLMDISESISSPEHSDKDMNSASPQEQKNNQLARSEESPGGASLTSNTDNEKKKKTKSKEVLIEGVLFRAKYLGSTQLVCEGQPTKSTRMMQAEEAVSRIKALAPEGEGQPSTEVDLFISTEKIMVLNTDLKEIMMDHALRTISYIADIGDLVVLMARRRFVPQDVDDAPKPNRTPKMICHVFESEEAQFIAQSIGQAFQVAYMEFLKANGIEDHSFVKEMDYQEVLNSQEIFGDELEIFAKKELQKEVVVPKAKGEILGVVIVESGWGSMLPTVVIANLLSNGAAARCGQLNIGDQIIAINGLSLVGLPLSTCQTYIKNTKNQTVVKFTVVPCAPVVEVKIKRPNTKYQLGFSVQNGVICSLLRGGIAERGGVRVGHRIIEINNQSVVAVPHEKIVNLLATSVGEILMKTMPTSMFRLLTGQENPIYI